MTAELDEELRRMAQHHIDNFGSSLGGVNPPDAGQAAAGTWQGDAPQGNDEVPDLLSQPAAAAKPVAPAVSVPPVAPQAPAGPAQPKFDGSQLLGWRPPPPAKDTELAGLQADAKKRRGEAQLGQAVTDFTERPTNFLDYAQRLGGGGVDAAPKSSIWKDYAAEGDRAISDLEDRRKADAGLTAAQTSAAALVAKKDPASETAKIYRSVLAQFSPNLAGQLEQATPEQMERIAPWLEKYYAENAAVLKAKVAAGAKENPEELASYKKVMAEKYPTYAAAFNALTSMKGAQDLQNAAEGELTRASNERVGDKAAYRADRFRKDAAEDARKEAEKNKDQAGAQHLGDKAGEGQSMGAALDDIDRTVSTNPEAIPGRMKANLTPEFAKPLVYSDDQLRVENDAKDVMAVLLHKRSGAAVNKDEYARYIQMYGLNGDAKQFKEGMARLRRDSAAELAATQAGVSPGARTMFKDSGGTLAEDLAPKNPAVPATVAKPSPGPGYVRGVVNGKPGWVNKALGEWEPD